jgi:glycosyltransferase involved in cell wall biosynthesis
MRASILFVHHRRELGGAPTSLSYLIRQLDRSKYDPHVFCPSGAAADLFREAGATVHTGPVAAFTHIWASTYRGRRWLLFLRELFVVPAHILAFRRTLRRHAFDLVHLNDSPLLLAGLIARLHRLPVVWHLRSSLPAEETRRSRLVRSVIRRLSTAAIAINEDVAASFDVGAEVIPNAVDLKRFRPGDKQAARARAGITDELPIVTFFGFIYPSKGFQEFLEAAARVRSSGIPARYLIVGGAVRGEEFFRRLGGRALLLAGLVMNHERIAHELVARLELDDVVTFIPFTMDTADLYRASDIVVAPSRGPELGRPLIEAAASGIPVVASGSRRGAGIVLNDETGVVTGSSRASILAEAISDLLRTPERRERFGHAARRHAEVAFDPRRNTARIESIYGRVLPREDRARVLFVHHRPQLGGAPTSLAHLIRHLDRRYEAHVLTPPGPAAELFANAGAIVHPAPAAIFAHPWDNPYRALRWLVLLRELWRLVPHRRALKRVLRSHRFAIVHLNDSPLLPAAQVAHRAGIRVVWHLRSALANGGGDRRSAAIRRVMQRWGDAAIAIDHDVAASFPLRIPISVIFNAAEPRLGPEPAAAKADLGLPPERVAIAFAGFIRRQKGWPELVRAARLVVDAEPAVHFVVIGGGVRSGAFFRTFRGRLLEILRIVSDDEKAMKELVGGVGLSDHFSFLPFTFDTSTAYLASEIVAFPNQGVGLGRPVLEAAAYGKPVVASGSVDGGGVLLPGVTGFLVVDPTPEALADALLSLVRTDVPRTRLGVAAAPHARAAFVPSHNAQLVTGVYDFLLGVADHRAQPLEPAEELTAVAR